MDAITERGRHLKLVKVNMGEGNVSPFIVQMLFAEKSVVCDAHDKHKGRGKHKDDD